MAATVPVAVTGYGQAKDRERALEAGFVHHLVKPVDMTALVRILESSASLAAQAEAAAACACEQFCTLISGVLMMLLSMKG